MDYHLVYSCWLSRQWSEWIKSEKQLMYEHDGGTPPSHSYSKEWKSYDGIICAVIYECTIFVLYGTIVPVLVDKQK